MQLALEYMKLGKLATARECIEKALSEDSSNSAVQETAGLVYERLNEMAKAEHAYETAVRLGKNDPNISNAFAGFLCRTGKTAAGEKMFNEVARNPLVPDSGSRAGECRRMRARRRESGGCRALFHPRSRDSPEHAGGSPAVGQCRLRPRRRGAGARYRAALSGPQSTHSGSAVAGLSARSANWATRWPPPCLRRRVQTEFPNSEQAQNMRSGVDR